MNNLPGGRDWNGNGKSDSFDRYIDYKASSVGNTNSNTHKPNGASNSNSEESQSDGAIFLKSLATIGLCIAGVAIPVSADVGPSTTAIFLLAAVYISARLWRK